MSTIYVENYDCAYAEKDADVILADQCGTKDNTFCKVRMNCTRKPAASIASLPPEANVVVTCKTDSDGHCPTNGNQCIADNGIIVYKEDLVTKKLEPRINERRTTQ